MLFKYIEKICVKWSLAFYLPYALIINAACIQLNDQTTYKILDCMDACHAQTYKVKSTITRKPICA